MVPDVTLDALQQHTLIDHLTVAKGYTDMARKTLTSQPPSQLDWGAVCRQLLDASTALELAAKLLRAAHSAGSGPAHGVPAGASRPPRRRPAAE